MAQALILDSEAHPQRPPRDRRRRPPLRHPPPGRLAVLDHDPTAARPFGLAGEAATLLTGRPPSRAPTPTPTAQRAFTPTFLTDFLTGEAGGDFFAALFFESAFLTGALAAGLSGGDFFCTAAGAGTPSTCA